MTVRRCAGCAGLVSQGSLASGNTFGATYWTDGRRIAPMLPDQPWLVKCPHCAAVAWVDALAEVGVIEPFAMPPPGLEAALPVVEPTLDDFLGVLEKGLQEPERREYAQVQAWWRANDERRDGSKGPPLSARERDNLEAIASHFDGTDERGLLMRAEALRELGRFEEALRALEKVGEPELAQAREVLAGLCRKRDVQVQEMKL